MNNRLNKRKFLFYNKIVIVDIKKQKINIEKSNFFWNYIIEEDDLEE